MYNIYEPSTTTYVMDIDIDLIEVLTQQVDQSSTLDQVERFTIHFGEDPKSRVQNDKFFIRSPLVPEEPTGT